MQLSDEQRETLQEKVALYQRVFNTSDGIKVLDYLREAYDPDDIKSADTHTTYYNLGQRSVVKDIEWIITLEKDDE